MKYSFVTFILLGLLIACNTSIDKNESTETKDDLPGHFGEEISTKDAISGKELLTLLSESDSVWASMKSTIVANCQSSGCWMELDLGNSEVAKITFKDYAFVIPIDSKGKTAIVEGFAKKEEIPVEMLKHYAEDEGKSKEEIERIVEPQMAYTFEAIGVVIEE